ncbi:MAG TPA: DUF3800 domain-containing protein [Pyrinomonadaceae bacterium]
MDETGHSQDEKQRFNGMAGIVAPLEHWAEFERKWYKTLKDFKIPHFHMKDFASSELADYSTKSKNPFKGWSRIKKEKLFQKLLKHMETTYIYPLGSSLCMEDFRSLTPKQRALFDDPYYMGFVAVLAYVGGFLDKAGAASSERAAIVFSDQVQFRHRALEFFEKAIGDEEFIKRRIDPPSFRDMRKVLPLQAADIVAYEMYKEHERQRYRPLDSPREGFQALQQMARRLGHDPLFRFRIQSDLLADVKAIEAEHRRIAYWQNRRRKGAP